MFRKQLIADLKEVFGFDKIRICMLDDETEVIYCYPREIVSTPIVGSGTTHFRVYCDLSINQDEANGTFGYLHHKLLTSTSSLRNKFQIQSDETANIQNLYDQHRVISTVQIVWESDIEWNDAPQIEGGTITDEIIE